MFNFTSLLGAQSSSSASQSLIELEGDIKILVDVGWDESFDPTLLDELEKHAKSISLILLTHATTSHLAAYAHCCKYFPGFSSIPVYATAPIKSLGRALLQDIYSSNPLAASSIPQSVVQELSSTAASKPSNILLQPPTSDEITSYFNLIHPLKYSQPHEPEASPSSPPLNGLTITAYSAGHSLGGTIWHLQHGLESIVYAVDWNQAKDSAIKSAAWLGAGGGEVIENLRRPTALICSSRCSQRLVLSGGRNTRDEQMLVHIKQTIARGGSVLIPSDSCARSLELAYFLEEAWNQEKPSIHGNADSLRSAKLYFASASGASTMRYARSMLEWMDQDIIREFEATNQTGRNQQGGNASIHAPFDFRYLKIVEKNVQLNKVLGITSPKVVLATDLSMEWGYARRLFESFNSDDRNLIILSEPLAQRIAGRSSLGSLLYGAYSEQSHGSSNAAKSVVDPRGTGLKFFESSTLPLEGDEISIYQQYLARERQRQWTMTADTTTSLREDVIDDNSSTSSEESIESTGEQQGKALNVTATLSHARQKANLTDAELGIEILIRKKGHYDYDIRGKKGRDKMYPVLPIRKNQRFDDYGEVIRPEDYLRAEERDTHEEHDPTTKKGEFDQALGQKRKWNETSANGDVANGITKKRKQGLDGDFDDGTASLTLTNAGPDFDELSDDTDVEEEERPPDGPVKAVLSEKTVALHIRIAYVDFSGLHDKRSMQMLIPLIKPRKLVLIGGDIAETLALKDECTKLLGVGGSAENSSEIFTPVIGEKLNASVDTNAWNVKLSIPLRRQLNWQTVGGLGVVPLTSYLKAETPAIEGEAAEESKSKRFKSEGATVNTELEGTAINKEANPVLDVVPTTSAKVTRMQARPLHVGDVRLSDLRKVMQSLHLTAEFRGEGTLLINGLVAIRKSAVGKVEVETVIGAEGFRVTDTTFNEVRRRIYASLAVISGT